MNCARAIAAVVCLSAAGPALAQQIVGGHALDNNLRVGSGGLNGRSSNTYNNAAIQRPNYSASVNTRNPNVPNQAVAGNVYWAGTGSADRGSMGYQASAPSGVTYGSPGAGAYYDTMSKPLYATNQTPFLIERGSGGGDSWGTGSGSRSQYLAVNEAPAMAAPRYRAYR